MIQKKADAVWKGNLKEGEGKFSLESGIVKEASYSFATRFGESKGSNPEELIAAAHASCFSMALANALSSDGFKVKKIHTSDKVLLEKSSDGFTITRIEVNVDADVERMDVATFQKHVDEVKKNCPVAKALKGVDFKVKAQLRQEA